MDWAGPAGGRYAECLGQLMADCGRIGNGPRRLRNGPSHLGLGHLLECPVSALERSVAAQEDEGRLGHPGNIKCRESVCESGAGRYEGDARAPGQPAPGVRHVYGRRLVPDVQ